MKSIFIIKKYKYMILAYEDNEIIELFRKIFVSIFEKSNGN